MGNKTVGMKKKIWVVYWTCWWYLNFDTKRAMNQTFNRLVHQGLFSRFKTKQCEKVYWNFMNEKKNVVGSVRKNDPRLDRHICGAEIKQTAIAWWIDNPKQNSKWNDR